MLDLVFTVTHESFTPPVIDVAHMKVAMDNSIQAIGSILFWKRVQTLTQVGRNTTFFLPQWQTAPEHTSANAPSFLVEPGYPSASDMALLEPPE